MVSRNGAYRGALMVLGLAAACVDHPMSTEPLPLEATGSGVVLYARLSTYPVAGADVQAIAMSVSGGGALPQGQQRFIGYHAWSITWRLVPRPRAGECAVADATVFLDSRITLPEWEVPPNPDPGVKEQWAEFLAALREHEVGHQILVREGAERVRQTLLDVRAAQCDHLVAKADSAGQEMLAAIRDEDARYDTETRHGATQGVIWPPTSASPSVTAP